jgi:hypothetical protein
VLNNQTIALTSSAKIRGFIQLNGLDNIMSCPEQEKQFISGKSINRSATRTIILL